MTRRTLIIGALVIIVVAIVVWQFGIYTYFLHTEVHEAMPVSESARTIVSGSFANADILHRGSGTARIVEENGKRILRLENFKVTNGPDLYVYLSESKTPGDTLESIDKYIILGKLKGNMGDQNYDIPAPFRGYDTAVIWCQEYGVLFAYAVME